MATDRKIFSRTDVHPVVLDAVLISQFGPEWLAWDTDSAFLAVERDSGTTLSRANKAKMLALGVLHSNHSYWEDWRAFEAVSWALSGKQVDLTQLNPLTPTVLAYGYHTAKMIDDTSVTSPEVDAYILTTFIQDQYSLLPRDFSRLQEALFKELPHVRERYDLVRSALAADKAGADMQDAESDPVKVEVTRHRVLAFVLNNVCSKDFVLAQARQYGVGDLVSKVLSGGSE